MNNLQGHFAKAKTYDRKCDEDAAVLGGIAAAPAPLAAGVFMENKTDEAMDEARRFRGESREFKGICSNGTPLEAIETQAQQTRDIMGKLKAFVEPSEEEMNLVIRREGMDWRDYGDEGKKTVGKSALLVKTLKLLIDTPLLHENGALTEALGNANAQIEGNHACCKFGLCCARVGTLPE